jgi:hypothetical protein
MRIKGAELEDKAESTTQAYIPPILDDDYATVHDAVLNSQQQDNSAGPLSTAIPEATAHDEENSGPTSHKRGNWIGISNVQISKKENPDITIEEEVTECFTTLESQ